MSLKNTLRKLVLTSTIVAITVSAQTPYDEGQKALREQRWMAAANHFEQVSDVANIDAAMYWRAHALYKAGHKGDAARQVQQLERQHPDSRWLNEARALQIEYQGSIDDAVAEDELRLFALSQLLERDFDRALPLVMEIMSNTASDSIRQDALFLLGMSDHPDAQRAIADAVSDSSDPDLQAHAVGILGMAGNDSSLALLEGMYTESASQEVKLAIIHAYFTSDQPGQLRDILQKENNPEVQRDIIHALGAMGATNELQALYTTLNDPESRTAAIEAFAIAGDTGMLKQVLATETDPEMRLAAIHGIAIHDDGESVDLIRSLYDQASTIEEKRVLMEALLIMDEAEDLAHQIVNTEVDPELLELAIHTLAVTGSTEALGGMYAQFTEVATRRMILEAMAIAGDTAGIRKALETEQDPELKVSAIHAIAMASEHGTAELLSGLYASGSREERAAVIESMMILDDASGLISLIRQENDPGLKREMMEMLSVMDSEQADEFLFEMLESKG